MTVQGWDRWRVAVVAATLSCGTPGLSQSGAQQEVLNGTQLASAFDIGVNSSGARTDWLSKDGEQMKMAYPSGQAWGAVFVTVGTPKDPPRPGIDLSAYLTLSLEVRGDPGKTVDIGIKDASQPDDGFETKVTVPIFANWRTYAIPLSKFVRVDLKKVYVATEFVFGGATAQTVWVRKIKYTATPAASVDGVFNGASFRSGMGSGTWVSLLGQNLSATTRAWGGPDFQQNKLPKALDGVSVNLDERDIAVSYISPAQINALLFIDVPSGPVYLSVTNTAGTSVPVRATVQVTFPALFTFDQEKGKYAAAVHADGTLVGKSGLFGPGVITRPAKPGDIILLYGTGFGVTNPTGVPDEIVQTPQPLQEPSQLRIRFGSTPADVLFSGLVLAGLYQFNVRVPNVADGDQPVALDLGSSSVQQSVFVTLQR